jgi:hypothetical protein
MKWLLVLVDLKTGSAPPLTWYTGVAPAFASGGGALKSVVEHKSKGRRVENAYIISEYGT